MKKIMAVFGTSALFAVGCAGNGSDTSSTSIAAQEATIEAAVTSLGGLADSESANAFASRTPIRDVRDWVSETLLPSAVAQTCGAAYSQTCNTANNTKSITYDGCSNPAGNVTLRGSIALTYSNNTCSLTAGNEVTRSYDLEFTGPRGGTLRVTSADRQTFTGVTVGGGGKLKRINASGWETTVLGKHNVITRNGVTLADVSIESTAVTVTNATTGNFVVRAGRQITGGSVTVYHNLAKVRAVFAPTNLTYQAACCHPTGGQLAASYYDESGSLITSGTVSFSGCGSATLTRADGSTAAVTLSYCE